MCRWQYDTFSIQGSYDASLSTVRIKMVGQNDHQKTLRIEFEEYEGPLMRIRKLRTLVSCLMEPDGV